MILSLKLVGQPQSLQDNKKGNALHISLIVEPRGVEPLSKHRRHWLSTCLFHDWLWAWGRT